MKNLLILGVFNDVGDIMNHRVVLISMLIILLYCGNGSAVTLEVGQGKTYVTIQSAVDSANPGDVVVVNEGVYSENVIIKKSGISISGNNREKVIIEGKKASSGININQANNVRISGLTIRNSGTSGQFDAGVTIYSAKDNVVSDMVLINNLVGVSIYSDSNNNVIAGNEIRSNSNNGILIHSSSNNRIYGNNIQENKIGIYVDQSKDNMIYSNNFISNSNEQAYDNGGQNSWDDGKSGNYWNDHKSQDAYTISGAPKAKDNYPLSSSAAIRYESSAVQKTEKEKASTPGFYGFELFVLIIAAATMRRKTSK
jgi:parallel beta-helix repeat protein